jgi:hypothetical protein
MCHSPRTSAPIVPRTSLADGGGGWTFDPTGSEKTADTYRLWTIRVRPAGAKQGAPQLHPHPRLALPPGTLQAVHRPSTALGCRCGG